MTVWPSSNTGSSRLAAKGTSNRSGRKPAPNERCQEAESLRLKGELLLAETRDEDRDARAIIAELAAVPGGAACSHPNLCYWAGKHTRINLSGASDLYFRPPRSHDLLRQLLQSGAVDAVEIYRGYEAATPEIVHVLATDFRRVDLPELRYRDATPRADDSLVFVRIGAAR